MITEALVVGAVAGLSIAIGRRYPWYGALCLFAVLSFVLIFILELGYSWIAERKAAIFVFGFSALFPYPMIVETRKAIAQQGVTATGMKYVHATYAATVVVSLWSIYRMADILFLH